MAAEIHVGDGGLALQFAVVDDAGSVKDVSSCTGLTFFLKPPVGTVRQFNGTFTNDGTDGLVEYVTADADLDQSGRWGYQARMVLGGTTWHTPVAYFKVLANLA